MVGAFGDLPRDYTEKELDEFKHKPGHLLQKRKQFERVVNGYFGNYLKDSPTQAQIRAYLTEAMNKKLASSGLEGKLIPEHGVGCKRPTPGVGYLEALTSRNTKIVFGDIKQVTPYGIVDNEGTEHPVDVLVCATGFDTTYKPRFPLLGAQGKNLEDEWAESTNAYMATAIPDFPNYFMFFGPNNPFASGSYISAIGESLGISLLWPRKCANFFPRMSSGLHAQVLRSLADRESSLFLSEKRSSRRFPSSRKGGPGQDSLGRRMPVMVQERYK